MSFFSEFIIKARNSAPVGYVISIAAVAIALAARMALDPVLPSGFPYLTFFPAVILTAFAAGTRPAILCAALSGLAAWYFFIPPVRTFSMNVQTAFALGFYIFIVTVDIALFHFMFRAVDQLRSERRVTAELYERQRTMFQELQHRVANNMSVVSALLAMQRRKVEADPSTASSAIDEAASRIGIMSSVHRRLYDPDSSELPIGQYFSDLCKDLLQAAKMNVRVECIVEADPVKLDIDRLMTLSLIVSELVTNSLKHAFNGKSEGRITLSLQYVEGDMLELIVSDNGTGIPEGLAMAKGEGLGTMITTALAEQLRGTLNMAGGAGTSAYLRFPVSAG
jgi:two-component sensor histidine kinase